MTQVAKFRIGQVVRHRIFPFRGVIFDVDPVFNNTEQWYQSIPAEIRPRKDQPFYHLLAENENPTMKPMFLSKICCRTSLVSLSNIPRFRRCSGSCMMTVTNC